MKNKEKDTNKEMESVIFRKENYKWMFIGLGIVFVGFLLMLGGGSDDPNVFNEDELFSFRRITLAPMVIIAGFIVEIYAIMLKSKN